VELVVGALVRPLEGVLVGALVGYVVGAGAEQDSQASGQAPLIGPLLQYLARLSVTALEFIVIQEQSTSTLDFSVNLKVASSSQQVPRHAWGQLSTTVER